MASHSLLGIEDETMSVPDSIEPIRAWRIYRLTDTGRLTSMVHAGAIEPGQAFHAECSVYGLTGGHEAPHEHCTCGIYAARDLAQLMRMGYDPTPAGLVLAEVKLWGRVVPAEFGYRAEFTYPHRLYCDDESVRQDLSIAYGVECLPMLDEIADARWAASLIRQTEDMRDRRIRREREERVQERIRAYLDGKSGRVPHPAHYSHARGNFGAIAAWIRAGRSGYRRPYRNNTELLLMDDGRIGMRLHSTIIAIWDGGEGFDSVEFDTGGWDTVTTRERMNDALGLFGIGGRIGPDSHYMPRIRASWGGTYVHSTLRYWPHGWNDPNLKRHHHGRTREGREEIARIRAYIETLPTIDCKF